MVPFCLFGEDAAKYWKLKDYSKDEAGKNILNEEYKIDMQLDNEYEQNIYRYPKCKLFVPKLSSNGICHTFNSEQLEKVLKPSKWTKSYLNSFGNQERKDILKSRDINLEDGLVFSLDSMQSYFLNMKQRTSKQKNINAFWLKVHPANEIPWIEKDESTWEKVSALKNDMSTKFVSIKGEIISFEVNFITLS